MTADVVSVSPYPFAGDTFDSNCVSMARIRSGGTGAPPDAMPASASRGRLARRGDSSSWRSTVGHHRRARDALLHEQVDRHVDVPLVHRHQLVARHRRHVEARQATDVEEREDLQRRALRRRVVGIRRHTGHGHRDGTHQQRVHDVRDVVAVRRQRALRGARRARRVEDRGVVVGGDRDVGQAAGRVERRAQVLPPHDTGGQVAAVAAHDDHLGSEAREVGREALEPLAVEEQRLATGVGDRVLELRTEPPRVQGDGDRAERHRRPEAHDPLRVVAHADGDAVALADAVLRRQPGSEPGDDAEVLGVRRALAVVDEEVTISEGGGRGEEVAHRRRRVGEHAQRHAGALDRLQFERLPRRGERGDGVGACDGHGVSTPCSGRPGQSCILMTRPALPGAAGAMYRN